MTHKELRANHRNAQPIVEFAVNPIIEKMRSDAHDQLGIVRTIYDQTAVSSRRGFVLRWEDEEIEEDRDKRYAENIWRISTERVISKSTPSLRVRTRFQEGHRRTNPSRR